jgi:aminoglycoside phosphotransferase (APT) family kinase protein
MAKKILSTFDVATISQVLNSEIPELVIDSITIIETGWDHLVAEVNEEWIFRFPRAEGSIANLQREKNLLDYLRNYITLPIPHHQHFGTNIAFVGYRKLLGIHLNQQVYTSLDLKVCHHIAKTLASFFTELHHAVSKDQAFEWGYAPVIRPLLEIESLLSTLPRDIGIMVKSAVDYARGDLSEEKNLVFIHQDINGDNLAFDLTSGKITGAFDFSDTGIGPYSWEFAELFVVDVELARLTAQIYATINNVPNPLIGGAADYILRKATWILDARKNGNSQKEKKFLEGLHDFLPIWRDVASIATKK